MEISRAQHRDKAVILRLLVQRTPRGFLWDPQLLPVHALSSSQITGTHVSGFHAKDVAARSHRSNNQRRIMPSHRRHVTHSLVFRVIADQNQQTLYRSGMLVKG